MSALIGDRNWLALEILGYCQSLPPIPTIADMCHLGKNPQKAFFQTLILKGLLDVSRVSLEAPTRGVG